MRKKPINLSGVIPSPYDPKDYPIRSIVKDFVELPMEVSLDDKIMKVLDQGFFGTCVGKASNSIMSKNYKEYLSSLYVYSLCKKYDGIPNSEGTYPRIAMKVMQEFGACTDATMPYSMMQAATKPPQVSEQAFAEGAKRKLTTYARATNLNEIKQALANGHLIMGVISVGDNFINYREGILGPTEGQNYGYHAVVFCGYSDIMGSVRGVNSWGESWGEQGFFWMSYATFFTSNNVVEAWIVEVKRTGPVYTQPCLEKLKAFVRRWKSRTYKGGESLMIKPFWMDQNFYIIIVTAILAILNEVLGFNIPTEAVWIVVLTILGYVFKDSAERIAVKVATISREGYETAVSMLKRK